MSMPLGLLSFCVLQLLSVPVEETTQPWHLWSTLLTFLTPMPRGGSATGPFGSQEPPTSTSTSPCLTSGILQTWWSCWTAIPTVSWSDSMGGIAHLCPLMSLWISSFCISSPIASIKPRDLLFYTKVRHSYWGQAPQDICVSGFSFPLGWLLNLEQFLLSTMRQELLTQLQIIPMHSTFPTLHWTTCLCFSFAILVVIMTVFMGRLKE